MMRTPLAERLWSKAIQADPEDNMSCWVWQGSRLGRKDTPYGQIRLPGRNGRRVPAHRVAWEELFGPIPGDLTVDHLCRNTLCINPYHMELVTRAENTRRAQRKAAA